MSTRIDIASDLTRETSSSNPHTYELFADMFQPGKVFLYLPHGEFTVTQDGACVAIPVEIWEKIRVFGVEKGEVHWGRWDEGVEDE